MGHWCCAASVLFLPSGFRKRVLRCRRQKKRLVSIDAPNTFAQIFSPQRNMGGFSGSAWGCEHAGIAFPENHRAMQQKRIPVRQLFRNLTKKHQSFQIFWGILRCCALLLTLFPAVFTLAFNVILSGHNLQPIFRTFL